MKITLIYVNNEKVANQGVGYIASKILEAGYTLKFFDTMYSSVEDMLVEESDIYLLSAATLAFEQAKQLAITIKTKYNTSLILFGGVHTIIAKGKILEECYAIDYICVGEGEDFIIEFLRKFDNNEDLTTIDNLGYRWEGDIIVNNLRCPTDLNTLPRFRHDIFNSFSVVQPHPFPGFCYVYATRGCPYKCAYCCNSCYLDMYKGDYLRFKNINYIIEDLCYLRDNYPIQFLFFGDEMVVSNEKFVTQLFPRIKEEVGLPYGCMARVERVTPSLVELFRKTGCGYVGMGVECGDEEFRKRFLNRHMTNEQIITAFQRLRSIPNIILTSYNMQGYPVKNDDELTEKTNALNRILKPDIVQMSLFFPFPGTALYDYCVARDLIDFSKVINARDVFSESMIDRSKL